MTNRSRTWWTATGLAVVVTALVALVASRSGNDDKGTGDQVPGGELAMLDGDTASLADYRGQPLVVNFLASWCVPCQAELPAFEQVHQDVGDRVAFLGVNLQNDVDAGQALVEQTGITFEVARDPDGTLFTAFEGTAMPTTAFVDAEGTIVEVHSGELTGAALADTIDRLFPP